VSFTGVVSTSGTVWVEQRKFILSTLRRFGFGKTGYQVKIQEEMTYFLERLEEIRGEPTDIAAVLETSIYNTVSSIVLGKRFDYSDAQFKHFIHLVEEMLKVNGIAGILNFFPILRFLPGDPFKYKLAIQRIQDILDFVKEMVSEHVEHFDENNIHDFTAAYLQQIAKVRQLCKTDSSFHGKFLTALLVLLIYFIDTSLKMSQHHLIRFPSRTMLILNLVFTSSRSGSTNTFSAYK
jgi:hypothetical protein